MPSVLIPSYPFLAFIFIPFLPFSSHPIHLFISPLSYSSHNSPTHPIQSIPLLCIPYLAYSSHPIHPSSLHSIISHIHVTIKKRIYLRTTADAALFGTIFDLQGVPRNMTVTRSSFIFEIFCDTFLLLKSHTF